MYSATLSTWNIQTEWTNNLNHIIAQFMTKQCMLWVLRNVRQWTYNSTHIHIVETPCTRRCSSSSRGGRFNLRKVLLVSTVQNTLWPHIRSSCCAVTDFCPCREYNCDSSVNKMEDKLNNFNNGVCLNSIQHWPSSEPVISSASQGNTDTSWNKKIHHRVQKCQPLGSIRRQVNHGQTTRYYFWKISINIILSIAPRSSNCAPSFMFPIKTIYVSLLSLHVPHDFPLSSSLI